ncbi:nitrilase-related carbon-nitrogen hydrolase [Denitratisoma oestradiolicum]|uniref:Nitrilase n=1 Tax=Denitratisoma oestradiolicum TaxID=311182 RepID=A0A6S6Y2N8_9PROT|nr:nitrilase-related carbon-nitrogen hydrolase [Denitratisoma oestradiolicum]CAB1369593.1 Nitrilase [Denitratisoma oestradiolicum]
MNEKQSVRRTLLKGLAGGSLALPFSAAGQVALGADMKSKSLERYQALALQTACQAVNRCANREEAQQRISENIARIRGQIMSSKVFVGSQLRLVVLPEYFLTSYPQKETIAAWTAKAAIEQDGAEYGQLGRICQDAKIYLCGNAYESDPNFPGLCFQVCFILNDSGTLILRYRRLISMYGATPHDVLHRFKEIYGEDSLFPVVDTPLGRLASVASEEILFPEVSRALALRGAEVLLHCSSEIASPRLTPKDVAKRARAYENVAYVISANSGGILDADIPSASADGMSKIVDYQGEVRAEAGSGESMAAHAEIDIAGLRHKRATPGMFNIFSRQRLELFASTYAGSVYPPNTMLDAGGQPFVPERSHFLNTQQRVIQRLTDTGVIADE